MAPCDLLLSNATWNEPSTMKVPLVVSRSFFATQWYIPWSDEVTLVILSFIFNFSKQFHRFNRELFNKIYNCDYKNSKWGKIREQHLTCRAIMLSRVDKDLRRMIERVRDFSTKVHGYEFELPYNRVCRKPPFCTYLIVSNDDRPRVPNAPSARGRLPPRIPVSPDFDFAQEPLCCVCE